MRRGLIGGGMFALLASNFNRLLRIDSGELSRKTYGKSTGTGAGYERAQERLKANREAQAKRLKNAAEPVVTRQQRRARLREEDKAIATDVQLAFFAMNGSFPKYPKRTFVHAPHDTLRT